MYTALRKTLTLDDALALSEIADVGASWQHATAKNNDALARLERGE